jgi:homoserine kinase
MGASLSGAGPSVFAWFEAARAAQAGAVAMAAAFGEAGLGSDVIVSPVAGPAARLLN